MTLGTDRVPLSVLTNVDRGFLDVVKANWALKDCQDIFHLLSLVGCFHFLDRFFFLSLVGYLQFLVMFLNFGGAAASTG